ncbi:MAG: SDR family NAD(P)-dependent oxidoreductase [Bdellovibrionota bacterium]
MNPNQKTALITGASSGIGWATALELSKRGWNLILGARRTDRLEVLAELIRHESSSQVFYEPLDVCLSTSVYQFISKIKTKAPHVDYLVNNAGLAYGTDSVDDADPKDWEAMMETNFMGVMRMVQATSAMMNPHSGARIVNIASIAGREAYEGGGGYCASKAAVKSLSRTLRLELLEKGIGVTSIDPGLVETEFSIVRYGGDETKARAVYEGLTPLRSEDVARSIDFVLSQPPHVNIDEILLTPIAQGFTKRTIRTKND